MQIEISDLQFKPIKDQVDNDEFDVEFFIHFGEDNLLRFEGSCSLDEKILIEQTVAKEKFS